MQFDFTYGKYLYRYEDGTIFKIYDADDFKEIMPVPKWLIETVEGLDRDAALLSLRTLLHGHTYGVGAGKKAKIREFKTLFNID
jgi:hypothetical protein